MSLQEKGRVLRLVVTLLGRAPGTESILPAAITTGCRSLVPLGAGTVVGVKEGLSSRVPWEYGITCKVSGGTVLSVGPCSSRPGRHGRDGKRNRGRLGKWARRLRQDNENTARGGAERNAA